MQDPGLSVRETVSALQLLCVHLSPQGDAAAVAALPTPSGQPFRIAPPDHSDPLTGCSTAFISPASGGDPGLTNCVVSFKHGCGDGDDGGAPPAAVLNGSAAWFGKSRGGAAAAAEELTALLPHFPAVWLEELAEALAGDLKLIRCESPWPAQPHNLSHSMCCQGPCAGFCDTP